MKTKLWATLSMGLLLAACDRPRPPEVIKPTGTVTDPHPTGTIDPRQAIEQEVVATVNGQPITMKQLMIPLLEAHGLDMMLQLVQLDLAQQLAAQEKVTVSDEDFKAERVRTLAKLFADADPNDYDALLVQFLNRERLNPAQFEMAVQMTAYLRAVSIPKLPRISEQTLRDTFGALYGETVEVRHIQCANLQEIQVAQNRLAAGEPFAKVAQELSRNTSSASLGGKLAAFSRQTQGIPQAFRDIAFSLKIDEVSDPVQAGDSYHLIKLEKKIPPKAVKFEDHRAAVEGELSERLIDAAVRQLRQDNAFKALQATKVDYPLLADQWNAKLAAYEKQAKDRDEVMRKMNEDRATDPTSQPAPDAMIPGGSLIKQGTPRPGQTRPSTQPATMPGPANVTGHPNDHVSPGKPTTAPATNPLSPVPLTRPASTQPATKAFEPIDAAKPAVTPILPATAPSTQDISPRAAEVARPPATLPAGSDSLSK